MVPRKSALNAKVDAVIQEHQGDVELLKAKLCELEKQVAEADQYHESRLEEKTKTLHENIKYYGSKTQELMHELVSRNPFDQETGTPNTLATIIKKIGIDAEKIKFCFKDEDFTDF